LTVAERSIVQWGTLSFAELCIEYGVVVLQSHIEKGNELLEDAGVLAQSGRLPDVSGYRELATLLKHQLQAFSTRLEDVRERIEATTRCYQLLDKVCIYYIYSKIGL